MHTVHLRISETASGRPTPVRLRVTGPDGTAYPPFGRFAEFPTGRGEAVGGHLKLGREVWAYIDGGCEIRLPAGVPLRIRATKGPEFTPLDETVTVGPGQLTLRFSISRWSDLRSAGWVPGDGRCHFLSPHAALVEAGCEDLAVVNVLAARQEIASLDGTAYPLAPDLLAFSGQAAALAADGRLVAVNTLNTHPVLGKVGLLHSHRPVFPLAFGPPDDTNDWSVCDWCDQCHRKGGLTTWVEPFATAGGVVGSEALVAAVLGKLDAIELTSDTSAAGVLRQVYALWTAGFPIPLIGSSGKSDNRTPLGAVRTYANAGADHSYRGWVEAVRGGRSFVTAGPLLTWSVDGNRIHAAAQSVTPFERLEVIADGQVIASAGAQAAGGICRAMLDATAASAGWFAIRCSPPTGPAFAHTSPVRLGPSPRRDEAAATLARLVRDTRAWIADAGGFASPKARQHLLDLCDQAVTRLGGGP